MCEWFLATRHHQFRLNMSKDDELLGISQDNPELITYIREVHLIAGSEHHHKPLESINNRPTEDVAYILRVLNNKVSCFSRVSSCNLKYSMVT